MKDIKISGIVVKGDQYGRKLGFPTINLDITPEGLPPGLKSGVYSGTASFVSRVPLDTYRAGILINPNGKVEAHLIGYDGDAYGKEVNLNLKKFLRDFKKFDTEKELIAQIQKDIEMC